MARATVKSMIDQQATPRWDLTPFFGSSDDRALHADIESVYARLDRLTAFYDDHEVRAIAPRVPNVDDLAVIEQILGDTNALHEQLRPLNAFLYGLVTTNSHDDAAASLTVQIQTRLAGMGPLWKRLEAWVAALGVDALAAGSEQAAAHAFALDRAVEYAAFQMSEPEEELASQLAPSGALAWQRLHGDIGSQLTANITNADGTTETIPVTMARGRATDHDPQRRRSAYEAELAAWETVAVPLAAAINGAKGETGVLNQRRGYSDDLEPALKGNNVDRQTLDAMNTAVVAALPDFRRYFNAKARLLGHDGGLPWWDLFAPVGGGDSVSWPEAMGHVGGAFSGYSSHLAQLAQRAFAESWIDAEIRPGKRGGAYCASFGDDVSRVMMNFDGSHESVSTLAHELGHAYHNVTMAMRTPIQRRMPMALAETASIFCETLLFQHMIGGVEDPAQRLGLLDTYLVGAAQVVVDIHSRFLFELEVCERRRTTSLSVAELCDAMLRAQDAAYGDGLAANFRHPYMWAVKPHYFTAFYNWPYTFGLLFGLGLYARFVEAPDEFRAGYDDLLSMAGMDSAAALGERFGININDPAFWKSSLDVIVAHIDDHERLAAAMR